MSLMSSMILEQERLIKRAGSVQRIPLHRGVFHGRLDIIPTVAASTLIRLVFRRPWASVLIAFDTHCLGHRRLLEFVMTKSIKERALEAGEPVTQTFSGGTMVRFGRIEQMDRSFDLEFWQKQSSLARLTAAWELVKWHHKRNNETEDEPRLQRSVASLQRLPG